VTLAPIHVLARGLIIDDGHILLTRPKNRPQLTYIPGGHVEMGETSQQALIRELKEELGISARIGHFGGVVEHTWESPEEKVHEINLIYLVKEHGLTRKQTPKSQEDYIEFVWAPLSKLDDFNVLPLSLSDSIQYFLDQKNQSFLISEMNWK
jgi:8-oxo-dGTP diphosphatase